ncbi:hypothetical protein ACA910_014793 [Epithemia clementina (nom. ined.)]
MNSSAQQEPDGRNQLRNQLQLQALIDRLGSSVSTTVDSNNIQPDRRNSSGAEPIARALTTTTGFTTTTTTTGLTPSTSGTIYPRASDEMHSDLSDHVSISLSSHDRSLAQILARLAHASHSPPPAQPTRDNQDLILVQLLQEHLRQQQQQSTDLVHNLQRMLALAVASQLRTPARTDGLPDQQSLLLSLITTGLLQQQQPLSSHNQSLTSIVPPPSSHAEFTMARPGSLSSQLLPQISNIAASIIRGNPHQQFNQVSNASPFHEALLRQAILSSSTCAGPSAPDSTTNHFPSLATAAQAVQTSFPVRSAPYPTTTTAVEPNLFTSDEGPERRKYTQEAFPYKLHRIVTRSEAKGDHHVITFLEEGGIWVRDRRTFVKEIMPLYFRAHGWSSFRRQLFSYQFPAVPPCAQKKGAFTNPFFLRGQPKLCDKVTRTDKDSKHGDPKIRRPSGSHST